MDNITKWLLEGDAAIRWQVHKYILDSKRKIICEEQKKIESEGWGKELLSHQDVNGLWGGGLYSPKWISTTYTLLLLKNLGLPENNFKAKKGCEMLLNNGFNSDGGISYFKSMNCSETCVTGIVLGILMYFKYKDERIHSLANHLLKYQMKDGGWNCQWYKGAQHSSVHTTINVLEALNEYTTIHPNKKIKIAIEEGKEFLLIHRLFKSHRTGEIIKPKMTMLPFPSHWTYNILRALEFMSETGKYDNRMDDAIEILLKKRNKDKTWNMQNKIQGRVYFDLEKTGKPSRIITLKALKILKWLNKN